MSLAPVRGHYGWIRIGPVEKENKNMTRLGFAAIAGLTAVALLTVSEVPSTFAQESGIYPQRFVATAISLGGLRVGGGSSPRGSAHVTIDVERTSTEVERQALRTAVEKGRRELAGVLGKTKPVGRIRVGDSLGYDLRYARQISEEDGQQHLILATDRPLEFGELMRSSRSLDYDVSVIELIVDADGKGSGTAIPAAQVKLDPASGDIQLINLSTTPVQLVNVRRAK